MNFLEAIGTDDDNCPHLINLELVTSFWEVSDDIVMVEFNNRNQSVEIKATLQGIKEIIEKVNRRS